MTGNPEDLSSAREIALPEIWSFQNADRVLRWCHLAKAATVSDCTLRKVETGSGKMPKWRVMLPDGEVLLVRKRHSPPTDTGFENLLLARSVEMHGDRLVPDGASTWLKHERFATSEIDLTSAAHSSWAIGISFVAESRDAEGRLLRPGLRNAQVGALHAVAAHWTVSTKPALIVMPTGTGKTEVMICCMVMRRPHRLFVLVPTDALRQQTFDKFCRLGILNNIGVVAPDIIRPVTGMMKSTPKSQEELKSVENCNVVVSTVAAIQAMPNNLLKRLAGMFDAAFFDEAHHLPAYSWDRIHDVFADKPVLQLTATPFRLDGQKIPGRIIYNFPLSAAQEQGYFRKIKFVEVFEADPEEGDTRIAELAVAQLRQDQAAGFTHILLARADTTDRAEAIFKMHYQSHTDLTPIIIHSRSPQYRQRLRDIKAGLHRIVVCVDMFGEGFDLPALKIAALHDPHKSLAITLQFTGRFTRDAKGIGDATLIANTADPRVSDAIEELYAEDSDWNVLIPDLSAKAIQSQLDFSDFLERMDQGKEDNEELFALNVLRPKTSTVIFKAPSFSPTKFRKGLKRGMHVERVWYSKDKDLVIFVTRSRIPIEWATIKEAANEIWDLFILSHNAQQKLLFIHSSQTGSLHAELAKAVSGKDATLIQGEKMFRAFHGISRLIFHNAGLYKRGAKLRFRMYAGLDIAEVIHPSAQSNATKSNMFGIGYEDGKHVSVGVSYKGRVWSMSAGSIPDWREWCGKVAKKIMDDSIPTDGFLKHALIPKEISQLPAKAVFLVSMPAEWYAAEMERTRMYEGADERSIHCLEIKSHAIVNQNTLNMAVGFDEKPAATFKLTWGTESFAVEQLSGSRLSLSMAGEKYSLAEYLTSNPPTIYFMDGSEVMGAYLLEVNSDIPHFFDPSTIIAFDWQRTDIETESKWRHGQKRSNSVQGPILDHLANEPNQIVFDDDDSGEVADIVEISEEKECVQFRLYHCKYSGGALAGIRVRDAAEVCAQAVRSVRWIMDPRRLIEHLKQRERRHLGGRPTRFEKGSLRTLMNLKRRLRKLRCRYEICIVQPGISKAQCDPEISTMLGAASNLVSEMTGLPLKVIASG